MPQTSTLLDDFVSRNGETDETDRDELKHVKRVGWMPTDWEVKRLDELADLSRGKFTARPRNDPKYYGGNIPFVQTGDVANADGWLTSFSQTLNEEGLKVSKMFPEGTILVTIAANIGCAAMATFDVACPDSVVALQPFEKTSGEWLLYAMQKRKDRLEHYAAQSAQKNINLRVLRPQKFATPPPEEQRRIAQILGTWDRAIEQVNALIDKKQKRLHGLRQRLLSGEVRFPEFEEPWEETTLGDYFQYFSNRNGDEQDLPVLSCSKVHGIIPQSEKFDQRVASKDTSNYKVVECGDLVYDPMLLWDASIGFLDCVERGVVSPAYYTFKFDEERGDRDFFRHLLATHWVKYQYKAISQGTNTRRRKAPRDAFLGIEVKVPSLPEQEKIAEVMRTAEVEIEKLEQKRDALKRQKKGLMQRLLTGAVRTV